MENERSLGLRFESCHIVYRAPQFTAEEISYLNAVVSSHLFWLGTLDEDVFAERLRADATCAKLRDLLRYMKEADVSEIECCAEGKPKEILKRCELESYPDV